MGNFGVSFQGRVTWRLGMASGNECAFGRKERCGLVRVNPHLDSPKISIPFVWAGDV